MLSGITLLTKQHEYIMIVYILAQIIFGKPEPNIAITVNAWSVYCTILSGKASYDKSRQPYMDTKCLKYWHALDVLM